MSYPSLLRVLEIKRPCGPTRSLPGSLPASGNRSAQKCWTPAPQEPLGESTGAQGARARTNDCLAHPAPPHLGSDLSQWTDRPALLAPTVQLVGHREIDVPE